MGEKPKFAFLGNSHMVFWALDVYFTSGVDSRRFTFEWQGYSILSEALKRASGL